MAGFRNSLPIAPTTNSDRTSAALRAAAVAAGVVSSVHGAAAVGLLIKTLQVPSPTHTIATELWLFGGSVGFVVIAAAAAILARVSTALFELESDHQERGLFGGSDRRSNPSELAHRLTSRSSALGLTEFHDPVAPIRTSDIVRTDRCNPLQGITARHE